MKVHFLPSLFVVAGCFAASSAPFATAAEKAAAQSLDQFGQNAAADFAGKVKSTAMLKQLDAAEQADLRSQPGRPQTGTAATAADSFFKVSKIKDRWWFVSPTGEKFYSLGIDCISPSVTSKDKRDDYRQNLMRKWGDKSYRSRFLTRTTARLRSWGFNTLGNWCDETTISGSRMPYVHMGPKTWECKVEYIEGDICDAFDPSFEKETRRVAAQLGRNKDDTLLVGYFVDNELPWWNLGYDVLAMGEKAPARSEFIKQLQSEYGTVAGVNRAWGTAAKSFAELRWPGDGKSARADKDLAQYRGRFAERFYRGWYQAIKAADPNHLILGSRIPYPMDEVVAACAHNTDVLSFNHYGADLPAIYDRYYKSFGKPMLIGEYAFDSLDAGLLKAHVRVKSQAERGAGYSYMTEQLAAKPYFVGSHYFQYVDEPVNGRASDGENSFNGFVSVCDVPYRELVKAARATNARIPAIHSGTTAPTQHRPHLVSGN